MGEWKDVPSGINQSRKVELLRGEGVEFDGKGRVLGEKKGGGKGSVWWDGPWDLGRVFEGEDFLR